MAKETGMHVILDNRGNPDFGQNSRRRLPGTAQGAVRVASLKEASEACRKYIEDNNLGGGNWTGGIIRDETCTEIGRVSYNGKVWPPGDWTPDSVPLFDPSAK
jgi:hypothetical protein